MPQNIYKYLDSKNIKYRIIEHDPIFTIEDAQNIDEEDSQKIVKNLFLRNQKGDRHFLVIIKGDKQINLKKLGSTLGVRLSFASDKRLKKYLNAVKGAVSPLGLYYNDDKNVTVAVDKDLLKEETVGVHPNDNSLTVFLSMEDLLEVIKDKAQKLLYLDF